jgi:N-formylmaleamate deformylase
VPDDRRSITDAHRDELRSLGAESRWVTGGPVRLHVLDYGGDKPPLLVLPGITSPAITWDFVVSPLRDRVRPIVVDLRGRGLSDTGDGYAAADFALDAEHVIRELGLERPLVLGHSLGARIGASLAARGNVELGGTILIDPPLCGPTRGGYPTPWSSFEQQLGEGYAGTTGDDVQRFYPRWPRAELTLRARWVATCDHDAVKRTYDEFTREDFFDWWPGVSAPAAFIYGADSPVVTGDGAREAGTANPHASQHEIPHAGHMVPWDNGPGFMEVLGSLLETTFGAAPAGAAHS